MKITSDESHSPAASRINYLDYLRVFAILAVIFLHASAQNFRTSDVRTLDWNICNIYEGMVRWGVPVFVMISGALFLSRTTEISKIYRKYIPRLAVAYIVWSTVYAIYVPTAKMLLFHENTFRITSIIGSIISGRTHLWFIPMIIGLYICLPIMEHIVKSPKVLRYFMIVSFIFAFIIPELHNLTVDLIGGLVGKAADRIYDVIIDDMRLHMVLGFPFYYMLGYILHTHDISKKQRKIIYMLGIAGYAFTVLADLIVALKTNEPCSTYYDNMSVNVAFMAAAMFVFAKYNIRGGVHLLLSESSQSSHSACICRI